VKHARDLAVRLREGADEVARDQEGDEHELGDVQAVRIRLALHPHAAQKLLEGAVRHAIAVEVDLALPERRGALLLGVAGDGPVPLGGLVERDAHDARREGDAQCRARAREASRKKERLPAVTSL
jgi:hypothetical protein